MFKIGNIKIKNNIALAPMAGVSNAAYMKIAEEMGCGFAITELISAEAIIRDNQKTFDMLKGIDSLNMKIGVQLFGADPDVLKEAAMIITKKFNIDFIDINMGCPVPKVALRSKAGSCLLKDPDKIGEIIKKVSQAIDIPLTIKIRSGWDSNSINALEIAKIAEEAGAKAITIHARTRSQGYSGKADWNIIKEVKENISIPVIGNGDIKNCYDAKKMLDETKCDAVMIGRASLGNPWIFKECIDYLNDETIPDEVSLKDKIDTIKKHLKYLLEIKSEKTTLLELRSHIAWYLKGIKGSSKIRQEVFKANTIKEVIDLLDKFYKESKNG